MNNHTPGPWYQEVAPDNRIRIKASSLCTIALVYKQPFGFKKNASLIAAAPEMLDLLMRIKDCFESLGGIPIHVNDFERVVAKALGEV